MSNRSKAKKRLVAEDKSDADEKDDASGNEADHQPVTVIAGEVIRAWQTQTRSKGENFFRYIFLPSLTFILSSNFTYLCNYFSLSSFTF